MFQNLDFFFFFFNVPTFQKSLTEVHSTQTQAWGEQRKDQATLPRLSEEPISGDEEKPSKRERKERRRPGCALKKSCPTPHAKLWGRGLEKCRKSLGI